MKKLIVIGTVLTVLIVFFAISIFSGSSDAVQSNEKKIRTDGVGLKTNVLEVNHAVSGSNKNDNKPNHKKTKPDNNSETFNEVALKMNFSKHGGRPAIKFEELRSLASTDVVVVTEMINQMIDNPEDHILELSALTMNCEGILKHLLPLEEVLNNQPFLKVLWDTGYCSRIGTETDPFYTHLELARQGNKLAQLILSGELYLALERKTINPRLYPIEYNVVSY